MQISAVLFHKLKAIGHKPSVALYTALEKKDTHNLFTLVDLSVLASSDANIKNWLRVLIKHSFIVMVTEDVYRKPFKNPRYLINPFWVSPVSRSTLIMDLWSRVRIK